MPDAKSQVPKKEWFKNIYIQIKSYKPVVGPIISKH